MIIARPILGFISLILVAGACLLMFFTLLGGGIDRNPTAQFYFLQADTSGIGSAAAQTRWTYWSSCAVVNDRNACPKVHPAYPFDPPRNFGTTNDVPPQFIGTHKFYYLTRFMFAFALIALVFAVLAFLLSILAMFSRIGSFLDGTLTMVALFFQTITASLMTAAFVIGRNAFRSAGRTAILGKYNFGFMWAATVCLFIATVLYFGGGAAGGSFMNRKKKSSAGGEGMFDGGRTKSTSKRNRGSFIDRSSFERHQDDRNVPLTNGV